MRYFVDTGFWIARLSKHDQWHEKALELTDRFKASDEFVTSNFVLLELLNYFSAAGPTHRNNASLFAEWIEEDRHHTILTVSGKLFRDARSMYARHNDKSWSLTDCTSFVIMKELDLKSILTFDHHFVQMGFPAIG